MIRKAETRPRFRSCKLVHYKTNQPTDLMTVNGEHPEFKHNGETNYPYESGKLQAYLTNLAERVESNTYSAEEYVEELKNKGILED